MDDALVASVPAQYARDFVATNLSPDQLNNDKMAYGLNLFPEVAKAVSGNTLSE